MHITKAANTDLGFVAGVEINDREFQLFRKLIYQHTGISLRDSKTTMLSARLSKRLRQLDLPSFESYYQLLQKHGPESDEYRQLINAVTTNKTSFFRESHHFEFLAAQLKKRKTMEPLRIWSAACSSGEEPYSIAITLSEHLNSLPGADIRILASDIDTQVLHDASEGLYDPEAIAEMPASYQSRYLLPEQTLQGRKFRVNDTLRNLITFRHRNLISPSWAINTKFDYIFCRNVLIYFDHDTQDQIVRRFIGFLKPQGHLIVGHSEQLHWLSALVEPVGCTIYRVRDTAAKK